MTQRSTGGEQQLSAFEGLVHSTARMYAAQVKREEEDLAQELRIVVWRAVDRYDPSKSRLPLKRYVFMAVTNKIKDYKRDAAREADRRERHGLTFLHIEDVRVFYNGDATGVTRSHQEMFESRHHFVARDEVYRQIDHGKFVLPASVTQAEANVLLLLMMEMSKPEIVLRLGMARPEVDRCVVALRQKFADWRPSTVSRTAELAVAA